MSFNDDKKFRMLLESSANPYAVVKDIMNSARIISDRFDNKILHSEAITHAVHKTEPAVNYVENVKNEYESRQIKELFCYIDDKKLCDAVYDSFYASKYKKKLIFIYNGIDNSDKQAHIRVLTRMLWYKLIIQEEVLDV